MSQSTATNGQSGSIFRAASFGPEELERFASLFVPIWDQPKDDVAAGPDPGFKAAPLGAMLAAELIPRSSRSTPPPGAVVGDEKSKIALAKTMAAIAPPPALPAISNDVPSKPSAPAAAATPAAFAKPRIETVSADLDALPPSGKSKMPMILGGLALAAAVVIGIVATRGGKDEGASTKSTATEVKAESTAKKEEASRLPDPAKVAETATAAATTAAPPATAETAKAPEPEKTAEPVKAEPVKTAEPPPAPKPPPVVAKPPTPPPTTPPATKPTYVAKPPATTPPATKPTAAKPKMKEDF
jgi:hypothetical protein